MSTLCPYRIIKGDDGLSVKVEWDVHYLTDEQIGIVRKYVAEIEAENAELRELVQDMYACIEALCSMVENSPGCSMCPTNQDEEKPCAAADVYCRMRELGVEV